MDASVFHHDLNNLIDDIVINFKFYARNAFWDYSGDMNSVEAILNASLNGKVLLHLQI